MSVNVTSKIISGIVSAENKTLTRNRSLSKGSTTRNTRILSYQPPKLSAPSLPHGSSGLHFSHLRRRVHPLFNFGVLDAFFVRLEGMFGIRKPAFMNPGRHPSYLVFEP